MSTSGKYLTVTVGGAAFTPRLTEWRAEETGEVLDDTSAASNGYEDWSDGVAGVQITVEYIHDVSDGPHPLIRKGMVLTNVRAFGSTFQATPDYYIPEAIVTQPSRTTQVKGQIRGSYQVRNKGYFEVDGVAARTL